MKMVWWSKLCLNSTCTVAHVRLYAVHPLLWANNSCQWANLACCTSLYLHDNVYIQWVRTMHHTWRCVQLLITWSSTCAAELGSPRLSQASLWTLCCCLLLPLQWQGQGSGVLADNLWKRVEHNVFIITLWGNGHLCFSYQSSFHCSVSTIISGNSHL